MLRRFDIIERAVLPSENDGAHILVFSSPDQAEREVIMRLLDLDAHTLDSALDPDEISRLEVTGDRTGLIFKRPRNYSSEEQFLFKVSSLGVFLTNKQMVVLMAEDLPIFSERMFADIGSLLEVVLRLLYRSIYHFFEHLKVISLISNEIEQKITTSMENKYLLHMFTLEKSLVYYLHAINTNAIVIEKLKANVVKLGFAVAETELLDDIAIENNQCLKQAEIYNNILMGLMDARGSVVNNNLNIQMKRLTIINIVFMPLNLLAGIGGMSEFSMMTSGISWHLSYPAFLVGMVIIGALTYFIIERIGSERRLVRRSTH